MNLFQSNYSASAYHKRIYESALLLLRWRDLNRLHVCMQASQFCAFVSAVGDQALTHHSEASSYLTLSSAGMCSVVCLQGSTHTDNFILSDYDRSQIALLFLSHSYLPAVSFLAPCLSSLLPLFLISFSLLFTYHLLFRIQMTKNLTSLIQLIPEETDTHQVSSQMCV